MRDGQNAIDDAARGAFGLVPSALLLVSSRVVSFQLIASAFKADWTLAIGLESRPSHPCRLVHLIDPFALSEGRRAGIVERAPRLATRASRLGFDAEHLHERPAREPARSDRARLFLRQLLGP